MIGLFVAEVILELVWRYVRITVWFFESLFVNPRNNAQPNPCVKLGER
jgi:hypothetical protein